VLRGALVLSIACAAFVFGVLETDDGLAAVFATALLGFVVAACVGPFTFARQAGERGLAPLRRGLTRGALLGGVAAILCGVQAALLDGPLAVAIAAGFVCGLYAFASGALSDMLRDGPARVAVAALGLTLLATLFFWDDFQLHDAADRKASAHLAFSLNAAAAASASLQFDWLHEKVLYTDNQTAESLVMVPLPGLGAFAGKLGILAAACVGLGYWRKA